jgi:thiamine biosynthesis lipoprotein
VSAEFERLEALMSTWRPGSDVLRINAAAGVQPVPVHADVRDVLRQARQISEWTEGTFDVTFGALTDVWKVRSRSGQLHPAEDGDSRAAAAHRLPRIEIDDRAGTVFLDAHGDEDPSRRHRQGLRGRACDRILRAAGLRDFMIQAGGDLYVGGHKDGRPWRLGINDPRGPEGKSFATIDLTDSTFSTSGDYARFFMKDGVRYHHILDPRTGQPPACAAA